MPVYAADVIASLQNLLVNDISMKKIIKGAEMDALKEFLIALSKVNAHTSCLTLFSGVISFSLHVIFSKEISLLVLTNLIARGKGW